LIDSRPEHDIRRQALRAPLWMILMFLLFVAVLVIKSEQLVAAALVFVLGVIAILTLGFLYIVFVFSLRDVVFGPYTGISTSGRQKWRWS
jgi:hypothetical protein